MGCVLLKPLPAGGEVEYADDVAAFGFPIGERISYQLYWGILPVGRAWISSEWIEHEGRRVIKLKARAVSNKLLALIYPVDDEVVSLVDPDGFLPVEFIKIQNAGRYRCNERTVFDRENLVGRLEGVQTRDGRYANRRVKEEYPIDPDTRDIVSFLYYLRRYSVEEKAGQTYRVMTGDRIYDLHTGTPRPESVRTPRYGRVECLEYTPQAALEAVFVEKGELWLWISRDARQLIVQARARGSLFSTVRMVIDRVTGPGDDAWTR